MMKCKDISSRALMRALREILKARQNVKAQRPREGGMGMRGCIPGLCLSCGTQGGPVLEPSGSLLGEKWLSASSNIAKPAPFLPE